MKSKSNSNKPNKFVAIKLCNDAASEKDVTHEADITMHLSSIKSQHRGRAVLAAAIEGFGLESPSGSEHVALVFEPLREPLWLFRSRLIGGEDMSITPMMPLIKLYIQILLEGLEFMHDEAHVIHTGTFPALAPYFSDIYIPYSPLLSDLKLDNILVTLEDPSVIEEFVQRQIQHPMGRKNVGDRIVYKCHNDFGNIDGMEVIKKMYPKITDFGLAQRGDTPGPRIHPIQPNHCKAPEVLLGTGWSYSADIWNFGVMVIASQASSSHLFDGC